MPIPELGDLTFSRSWLNPSQFPTYEGDEDTVRKDMQFLHDVTKDHINGKVKPRINELIEAVENMVQASIPDGSITTAKLASDPPPVTLEKLASDVTAAALGGALAAHLHALNDITDLNTLTASMTAITAADLGAYVKPGTGIPKTDFADAVKTSLGKADTAYQKPGAGIPKTDLADAVQTSLGLADTAYQKPGTGVPYSDMASDSKSYPLTGTATVGHWASSPYPYQQVNFLNLPADANIIVSPAPSSFTVWRDCGVYCQSQTLNAIVLRAEEVPESDITVQVLVVR